MSTSDETSENEVSFEIVKNINLETMELDTVIYFGWVDYFSFGCILLICCLIGQYFGFVKSSKNATDYLLGGRTMKTFPVAMSLIASYISGISLLGIPAEIYVHGMQFLYVICGYPLLGLTFQIIFLPVFNSLNITSVYEYLEKRFDRRVRFFGLLVFTINLVMWLPIVMYVPALTFNQVTGVNIYITSSVIAAVSIFYTAVGGIRAVIWSDVLQTGVMLASVLIIIVKGSIDVGGPRVVIDRNLMGDRIERPNFDINPLVRHTFWSLAVSGYMSTLASNTINQTMIQKYLSLPTVAAAKRANWIFLFGLSLSLILCSYTGLIIYAIYYDCDPLSTKSVQAKDQLVPLLMMKILGNYPGLPGLFVGGVFSASLSSLSASFNAMSAVVLEDFYKLVFSKSYTDKSSAIVMKSTVVILGVVCAALVPVVRYLGLIFQLSLSFSAISLGALFGIFIMGVLIPWINVKGALVGGISSLLLTSWVCLNAQMAIANGNLRFTEKPVSVDGCGYNVTMSETYNMSRHQDEIFLLYRISYLWYAVIGVTSSVLIGMIVSVFSRQNPLNVQPELLTPFVRRMYFPQLSRRVSKNENEVSNRIVIANKTKIQEKPSSAVEATDLLLNRELT